MTVGQNHAAVQTHVAGLACGHDLQLGGEEVLLLHAVLLLQDVQHALLHGVLVAVGYRAAAHDQIELLALDELACVALHLILRQMGQQIGDAEHRIVRVLADDHVHPRAVLLHDHAVQRERLGDPLVLLDAAVVVGIQIGQVGILIEGVLLHVDAGGIDVRAQDVHALLHRLFADDEQQENLVHPVAVHLVAGLELPVLRHALVQIQEAALFGLRAADRGALALGLSVIQEGAVVPGKGLQAIQRLRIVFLPHILAFHGSFTPFLYFSRCPYHSARAR